MRWTWLVLTGCSSVSWLGDTVTSPRAGESTVSSGSTPSSSAETSATSPVAEGDCGGGTLTTWENTGNPLLRTWCTPCHSSEVEGAARAGAPPGVDFDTYESTVRWSDALLREVSLEQTMPPAGGMTVEERDRLTEWVTCDMPHDATLTGSMQGEGCDPLVWFDGDVVLRPGEPGPCTQGVNAVTGAVVVEGGEAAALDCLCVIDDELEIRSLPEGSWALPRLTRIEGDLVVQGVTESSAVELPGLERVGGGLQLVDNEGLQSVELSGVEGRLGGPLLVTGNALLDTLRVPYVRGVEGDLWISENASLRRIEAMRVTDVVGSVWLERNPMLGDVDGFGSLLDVAGDVVVTEAESLESFNGFGQLLVVGGDVRIESLAHLEQMSGFHALEDVAGSVSVRDLPELRELHSFIRLETIGGALQLVDIPRGERLEGLVFLRSVGMEVEAELGGIRIHDVGFSSLPRFDSLTELAGLEVSSAPSLEVLEGLESVSEIPASVRLTWLPRLSAADFLPSVEWIGGSLTIEGTAMLGQIRGLSHLQRVDGSVRIADNAALERLPRLVSLTDVGGLLVARNGVLVSLDGLEALSASSLSVEVDDNPSLVSIGGLGQLRKVSEGLTIRDNGALSRLLPLSEVDYVGGDLTLVGNGGVSATQAWLLVESIGRGHIEGVVVIDVDGSADGD